jgi:hypothetical protein
MGLKLTPTQLEKIKEPFPQEALTKDTSRGFELTSIKAMYVIERLNDVFGLGNWWYVFSTPETVEIGNVVEVMVVVKLVVSAELCENGNNFEIGQAGGKKVVNNNYTDARKSAITDGLTKCASILGIGIDVFKGNVKADGSGGHISDPRPPEKASAPRPDKYEPKAGAGVMTKTKTELHKLLEKVCEEADDVQSCMAETLSNLTEFEKDGKMVSGQRSILKMSEKFAKMTLAKAKKEFANEMS